MYVKSFVRGSFKKLSYAKDKTKSTRFIIFSFTITLQNIHHQLIYTFLILKSIV